MNEKKLALENAHLLLSDPDTVREAAAQAAESVAEYVQEHPFRVVGAALALGLVAGFLIHPKRKRQSL